MGGLVAPTLKGFFLPLGVYATARHKENPKGFGNDFLVI